ncbi:tetratricopeptide repeat protein [Taklimakanibacter lacteus]|uniref:tetratricopeptide repeat protein n=1 Tax=Taklimakanibacter lacteus TaxID=2268456 RepID=UPI000E660841
MTIGERIAWIWVWSALALLSVTLTIIIAQYWSLPLAYFDAFLCEGQNRAIADSACNRLAANEDAPVGLRSMALRRSIEGKGNAPEVAIARLSQLIELGTADAEDWNNRGIGHYRLGDFAKAADDFRTAGAINSRVGIYWSNLADAQLKSEKYAEAVMNYTTAMRKGYDNADVRGNRGWARYQLGSFNNALSDFDKAISRDTSHADNYNNRGLVHYAMRNYDQALADFDQALKLNKDGVAFLTNRAMTYTATGQFEKAGLDLERAIALNADYSPAHLEKSWLLIYTDRSAEALTELAVVERLAPLDIFALEARGRALYAQGLRREAIADAEKAMALNDQYTWPFQLRSEIRQDFDDFEGSIADSTLILKRYPTSVDALATRSFSLQLSGHLDAALADLERAIELGTAPAYAYESRSYLNLYAGRLAAAISDARQSVALAPKSIDSRIALGWAYIDSGNPASGILECNEALSIKETDRALRCRAIAHLRLNQLPEALADAKRAFAFNSNSANNNITLGRIELAQGKPDSALARFDVASRLLPFDRAGVHMYRGDAERARGQMAKARLAYLEAGKRDLGLYATALEERLASLPAQ